MRMIIAVTSDAGVHSPAARAAGAELVAALLDALAVRCRSDIGVDGASGGCAGVDQ